MGDSPRPVERAAPPGLAVRPRSVAVAGQDFMVVEPFEVRQ
ncbi:hypothetical protein [Streptomyces canus]